MARKLWVVLVENSHNWYGGEYRGQVFVHKEESESISIFTDQASAEQWAIDQAKKNPGWDVQIFEPTHGYCTQPSEAFKKIWKEGKFIPA